MEKIKIIEVEYEIISINHQSNNLLEIKFPEVKDLTGKNLSTIKLFTSGGILCANLSGYNTIYKTDGNKVILSNDGSTYAEPTVPEPVEPHVPTPEEITQRLEGAKENKVTQSKTLLDKYLAEHPLLFTDSNYYSVTSEKQGLLTSALALYDLKLKSGLSPVFKWNSTGDTCVEMQIETGASLAIAIGDYVEPIVEQQRIIEKHINACALMAELESVVITYEAIN